MQICLWQIASLLCKHAPRLALRKIRGEIWVTGDLLPEHMAEIDNDAPDDQAALEAMPTVVLTLFAFGEQIPPHGPVDLCDI
jgi:hypothetical protein